MCRMFILGCSLGKGGEGSSIEQREKLNFDVIFVAPSAHTRGQYRSWDNSSALSPVGALGPGLYTSMD